MINRTGDKMTAEKAIKICKDAHEKGTRSDLRNADLRNADLRNANLQGADLRNADLRNANLRNANLQGADLQDANLRNADLQGADLQGADLQDADLRDADLRDADLQGADLQGADLPCRIIQISPIGSRKSQTVYNATHDFIRCGCFSGTLDEFSAKVSETHIGNRYNLEYSAMIIFLRTMREIEISSEVK